ncbi:MAG: Gfo/Idh/MocA family oxidoreductase [Propionibacteriaceae bacterium]|jgi:predicted dehydrogenase|nr:Gfo/Idh/MocA family oxidoreductase [Propionibacteriaceae bacterium]
MLSIAQVGLRGFGHVHLERIDRLAAAGRIELVAGSDPAGPLEGRDIPWYPSLTELLAHHDVDIVSIATPIGTHMALAEEALAADSHVFLEKPPVASLGGFDHLVARSAALGKAVQIGFQSLGGGGVARMRELAAATLGEIQRVQVWGMWQRDLAYFKRARWAGHRVLDGARVADGVCTNALAHSIATACAIVGLRRPDDLSFIETELYHAFDTESDDTSWLRIHRPAGASIDVSLSLCGPRVFPPTVTLVGTEGWASLLYTEDEVIWSRGGGDPHQAFVDGVELGAGAPVEHEQWGRMDLLENLVDHIEDGVSLLVPVAQTAGFMSALEATQSVPDPTAITSDVVWEGEGDAAHPIPDDLERWQHVCLATGQGYAAAGAPWASASAAARWSRAEL